MSICRSPSTTEGHRVVRDKSKSLNINSPFKEWQKTTEILRYEDEITDLNGNDR